MMHHPGRHHYHLIRLSELKRLYWAHTVSMLASSMTGIFIPIYLYRFGYSVPEIMAYYLWFSVFWGAMQYAVLRFANLIGFNRSMGASMIIHGLQILMLATISVYHWPLWLIALTWALYVAMYWPSFRACFARSLLHKQAGPAVGIATALILCAYGIAPAIGGVIASQLGITVLYMMAMLCFLFAAIPLFGGSEMIRHEPFKLRALQLRRVWRDLVANMGDNIDDSVSTIIWPLFIFLLVPSYMGVGVLSSIAVIASIIIAIYIGRNQARKGTAGYLKRGTLTISLANAVRILVQSSGQIAGINFINGIGHALMSTPYDSRYYRNADREPLLPYVYGMMMAGAAGCFVLFGTLLAVSLVAPITTVLIVGLIMAIPASYIIRLMRV
ncbi:MAG TPA: hypothetical protein VF272_01455 [Candidatus Saccharimonadia bacterium]